MATVNFTQSTLSSEGAYATASAGDSGINQYGINFTIGGLLSSITLRFEATGATTRTITYTNTGTYAIALVTTNTSPTITVTMVQRDGGYVTLTNVNYPEATTAPDAPTISVANPVDGDGARALDISVTDPSHPLTIKNRTIQVVNQSNGVVITKIITTKSIRVYGLDDYTTYKVRAKVTDINDISSDYSAYTTKTTYSKPDTPTLSIGTITGTTAVLKTSAYSNDDSSTHKYSDWIIRNESTSAVIENNSDDVTNLESYTVTGLTDGGDYSFIAAHRSNNIVLSDYGTRKSFSTSEASAKQAKGTVIIQATFTMQSKGGTYITSDPDIMRANGSAYISGRNTLQAKGSVWIDRNPWQEETTSASTTWTEDGDS